MSVWPGRKGIVTVSIYYPFALNTYYNEMNQEIQLKARTSQEAMEAYKEDSLIWRSPSNVQ